MGDRKYYSNLQSTGKSLVDLLSDESSFSEVPDSWQVIVVDIQKSTQAVNEGKHHQINLTATGAIISVLNSIRRAKKYTEIPYFFGGDGATFLIPKLLLKNVTAVLENYSLHIKRNTGLILRVGHISVEELKLQHFILKLAKHQLTEQLTIPVVLGNGLKKAEGIIKDTFVENTATNFKKDLLNLEGMECRWKQISPMQTKNKVVCLLVDSLEDKDQGEIYKMILKKMDALFGSFENRQPIKSTKLKLNFGISNIWEEMKVTLVDKNWFYVFKNWMATLFGVVYLNLSRNGKHYLKQIGQLSHTFMLDGMINTVFTGEQEKIDIFTDYLNQLEKDEKIIYGIHITHASIMSCFVVDRKTRHSHFVDGTEGGYTSAAKMFKMKMRNLNGPLGANFQGK